MACDMKLEGSFAILVLGVVDFTFEFFYNFCADVKAKTPAFAVSTCSELREGFKQ